MNGNLKFNGTLDELKRMLELIVLEGTWDDEPNDCWKFTDRDGAGMHWSQTKGTIWFDGPTEAKAALTSKVEEILGDGVQGPTATAKDDQLIFVVHGHDHNIGEGRRPIIEALEHRIGKNGVAAFDIVLLTPDEVGSAKSEATTEAKPRARQNVILEMGMLLASLTRKRVAILQKGYVERPSDLEGCPVHSP